MICELGKEKNPALFGFGFFFVVSPTFQETS